LIFEFVSDFDIRISDFSLPDNSLPNMMIQSTQLSDYVVPAGLFMPTQPQNLSREMAHAYLTGTAPRANRLSSPACQPIMTLFMQNKANFLRTQMNLSSLKTMNYEQITMNNANKNKPNQTQFQTQRLSKLFLAFTFLCPIYNLTMQTWTIQKLLNWTTEHFTKKGIDSPRLSAELLLSHLLNMKRIELYTQFDKLVSQQQLDQLHDLVKQASQYEPIAYLTGKTEFYSLQLDVTPDCMIPRPETELLVERAIEFLRRRTSRQFVCDLCTGCGCIAVAIAKNFHDADIIATDISDAALNIAAQNIEKHKLKDRIKLLSGDLFDPLIPQLDVSKFDLIVCNPPYVSAAEFESLDRYIKAFEPRIALYAGEDGLDVYRRIIEKVDQFLKADAALMLEIGYAQGQAVRELLEQAACFTQITIEKDYHNNDRIVTATRTSS